MAICKDRKEEAHTVSPFGTRKMLNEIFRYYTSEAKPRYLFVILLNEIIYEIAYIYLGRIGFGFRMIYSFNIMV